jgi:hypothetical protein
MRRAIAISILTAASLQLLAGAALAGPEWCDDGSPPPNDFRLQKTGAQSTVSSTSWLRSTSWSGDTWSVTQTGTVTGGVAKGMHEALDHTGHD